MMISWCCRLVRHEYVDCNKALITNNVTTYKRHGNVVGWCIGHSWDRQSPVLYCHLCVAKKDTFLRYTFRQEDLNEITSGSSICSILLFAMYWYGWLLCEGSWAAQNCIAADHHV